MYCILGYLAAVVIGVTLPRDLQPVAFLLALGVVVTAAVFVFMLSLSVYNTAAGIILAIFTLVPLVGLLMLLIINGKATTILRQHGIRVGLMGADPKQIPSPGQIMTR
jgi:hypothetical protein